VSAVCLSRPVAPSGNRFPRRAFNRSPRKVIFERRKAQIDEGDRVEVRASGRDFLIVKKVPRIQELRKKLAGKLSQWRELEGQADELLEKEA